MGSNRANGVKDVNVTREDLHRLVDEVARDERMLDRAFQLLSSLKEEIRVEPIPLPKEGTSAQEVIRFLESHRLEPEDAEEMIRFTEELDRLDNVISWPEEKWAKESCWIPTLNHALGWSDILAVGRPDFRADCRRSLKHTLCN